MTIKKNHLIKYPSMRLNFKNIFYQIFEVIAELGDKREW